MKKIILFLILLVVLVFFKFYFFGEVYIQNKVEVYLKENISNLSPEKEVLGGKFYVTDVSFYKNHSGKVDYEDGHIAFSAKFIYKISLLNKVNIISFEIIK